MQKRRIINAGKYNKKITIVKKIPNKLRDGTQGEGRLVPILECYAQIKTTRGYTIIRNDSDFENAKICFFFFFSKKVDDAYNKGIYIENDEEKHTSLRNLLVIFKGNQYVVEYFNNIDLDNLEIELQTRRVMGYN